MHLLDDSLWLDASGKAASLQHPRLRIAEVCGPNSHCRDEATVPGSGAGVLVRQTFFGKPSSVWLNIKIPGRVQMHPDIQELCFKHRMGSECWELIHHYICTLWEAPQVKVSWGYEKIVSEASQFYPGPPTQIGTYYEPLQEKARYDSRGCPYMNSP